MDQRTTLQKRALIASFVVLLCVGAFLPSKAQWIKTIPVNRDTVFFDSSWIWPPSLTVKGYAMHHDYILIGPTGTLRWIAQPRPDSITLSYVPVGHVPDSVYRRKNDALMDRFHRQPMHDFYTPEQPFKNGLIDKGGLTMLGNITRGVTTGNNQNVVVNSNLNLQMKGELENGVSVLAVISDDNNPIQPEGNTQQLQDFDKVFIQLGKSTHRLTAGDFEMNAPLNGYFLRYHKRSRGLQLVDAWQTGKMMHHVGGEVALSRGRFSRNTFNGKEGNQGPYRLTGANGEVFMILIAGTEVVYLDGDRLKRGEGNDYIMDYNSGEITFTAKHLITRFSRIVVEFQYSDRNYARSVMAFNDHATWRKWTFTLGLFSEQDHKNQPFQQDLTESEKYLLYQAGSETRMLEVATDTYTKAFDPNRIQYVKRDTLYQGGVIPYFRYTPVESGDTAYYQVTFSYVGIGNGHYLPEASAVNGKVFQWVGNNGSYEPMLKLVSPNRKQLGTVGARWQPDSVHTLWFEGAISNTFRNTFAKPNPNLALGYAFRGGWDFQKKSGQGKKWLWKGTTTYEQTSTQYRPIERFRSVEFERTWMPALSNQPVKDTGYQEHIAETRWTLNAPQLQAQAGGGFYNRNNDWWSLREAASAMGHRSLLFGRINQEWNRQFQHSIPGFDGQFLKTLAQGGIEWKGYRLGAQSQQEQNKLRRADTLSVGSYAWTQQGVYIESVDSSTWYFHLEANRRRDYAVEANNWMRYAQGTNFGAQFGWRDEHMRFVRASATWRDFLVDTATSSRVKQLVTCIETDWYAWKRLLTYTGFYQTGQGQELKRQYTYLEVQPGQGIYQWNDYNNDGLQQLNEFEVASFRDHARFIRLFVPTNDYVPAYTLQTNQTIGLEPSRWFSSKKWVSRFSYSGNWRLDRKWWFVNRTGEALNPFASFVPDTQLVSYNTLVRHTLYVNRNNPLFGLDVNYADARSRQLLTNGLESRGRIDRQLNLRWNPSTTWGFQFTLNRVTRSLGSGFFHNRNYLVKLTELKPKVLWQFRSKLRLSISATWLQGANDQRQGGEKVDSRSLEWEGRYNYQANAALTFRYTANQTRFNGDLNTPLAFDLLQGFRTGSNHIWSVSLQQRVAKNTQLTLDYTGRKTAGGPLVHIIRVEARYLF